MSEDEKLEKKALSEDDASQPATDPEREAKLKAAAEARAARAAAKAQADAAGTGKVMGEAEKGEQPASAPSPSPKQPELELVVSHIKEHVSEAALEDAYLNELNGHMPTIIIHNHNWLRTAELLRTDEQLQFSYLRNVSGVDYETHLEVVYHLVSLQTKRELAVKVRADRESAEVASVTSVWKTANWNEREIYDLLGIAFLGHPDMRRIMMPDDWVGYPLRKDYEPLDSEV